MLKHVLLLICSVLLTETSANRNLDQLIDYDYSINKNIFAIEPKSNLIYDRTNPKRKSNRDYVVQNIGRYPVVVTDDSCWVNRPSIIVNPGCKKFLAGNASKPMKHFLKILNKKSVRAIVYLSGGSDTIGDPPKDYDNTKMLKEVFALGVKNIPSVSKCGFKVLLSTFWYSNGKSVWDLLHEKLGRFLDVKTAANILTVLNQDLKEINKTITDFCKNIGNYEWDHVKDYMRIAKHLIGLENKFVIKKKSNKNYLLTNFYLLPYYANVTMKIHFYAAGRLALCIKLKSSEIGLIRDLTGELIYGTKSEKGAIQYIEEMYKNAIDVIYSSVYPGGLYNVIMNARTHIALHGLEMIPIWEKTHNEIRNLNHAFIDVISYSEFYGTATPTLFQQAIPSDVPAPLTPTFPPEEDRRKKLLYIDFDICRDANQLRIVRGLKLEFDDKRIHFLGIECEEKQKLDLKGRNIAKLTVYGGNVVKCLQFTLSDDTMETLGDECSIKPAVFELKDHYIASLFVSNDNPKTGSDLDNLAVAFARKRDDTLNI